MFMLLYNGWLAGVHRACFSSSEDMKAKVKGRIRISRRRTA